MGFEVAEVVQMTSQLTRHYGRVRDELPAQRPQLQGKVSQAYIERMLIGLQNWVDAGERGYLAWGTLKLRKR